MSWEEQRGMLISYIEKGDHVKAQILGIAGAAMHATTKEKLDHDLEGIINQIADCERESRRAGMPLMVKTRLQGELIDGSLVAQIAGFDDLMVIFEHPSDAAKWMTAIGQEAMKVVDREESRK